MCFHELKHFEQFERMRRPLTPELFQEERERCEREARDYEEKALFLHGGLFHRLANPDPLPLRDTL